MAEPSASELAEELERVKIAARKLKQHFFSVLNGVPLERGDVQEIIELGGFVDGLQFGGEEGDWDDDDDDVDDIIEEEDEEGEEYDSDSEVFYEAPSFKENEDDSSREDKPERKKARRRVTLDGAAEMAGV